MEAVQDAWLVNRQVTMVDEKCAYTSMCQFNEWYKDSNQIVRTIVKGISMINAYSWTTLFPDDIQYGRLYEAMWNGLDERKCGDIYSTAPKQCADVFEEKQRRMKKGDLMDLNYEHTEL